MSRACLWVVVVATLGCEDTSDNRNPTTTMPTTPTTENSSTDAVAPSESSSTAAEGSTTTPLPGACEDDSECRLHGDCCTCEALPIDATPESCDLECDRTKCEDWGITELLCSHTCLVRLVECDATLVECSDPPPDCAQGLLPSVEMRCWTRHCVPAELCALA